MLGTSCGFREITLCDFESPHGGQSKRELVEITMPLTALAVRFSISMFACPKISCHSSAVRVVVGSSDEVRYAWSDAKERAAGASEGSVTTRKLGIPSISGK